MKLKILLPTEVLLEEEVNKINAEGEHGAFGLLPRHIDFVAILVPGILSFETEAGREEFLAVDEGVLVKCGPEVLVSTMYAVRSPDLKKLKQTVEQQFRILNDREMKARTALARLQTNFVKRFMEIREDRRG